MCCGGSPTTATNPGPYPERDDRHDLGIGRRVPKPPVVRLPGKLEHPAHHRHGDPRLGELCHELATQPVACARMADLGPVGMAPCSDQD